MVVNDITCEKVELDTLFEFSYDEPGGAYFEVYFEKDALPISTFDINTPPDSGLIVESLHLLME